MGIKLGGEMEGHGVLEGGYEILVGNTEEAVRKAYA
jgi:hypothetical protein